MSIKVNTNIQSLIAQNSVNRNVKLLEKSMTQLSTGLRINSAKDDAAGLVISEGMSIQISASEKAQTNIQDALNLINIAEGNMISINEDLQRIRELCVQGANEIYTTDSKQAILNEIQSRLDNIDVMAKGCNFNGLKLLDGSMDTLYIQYGYGSDKDLHALDISTISENLQISAGGLNAELPEGITGATMTSDMFRAYMAQIDASIEKVSRSRGDCGTYSNRLESTSSNLTTTIENLTAAKSSIVDVDIAKAASDMIKYQILQQTSASVLTQANQLPALALSLLS